MSNIGKHVFEVRDSWAWYRGKVARETEQTWFFENARRCLKDKRHVLVDGDIDPEAAMAAFDAAHKAHNGPVEAAKSALSTAKAAQRVAAIAALRGKRK